MEQKVIKLIKNISFHLSYAIIAFTGIVFVFVVDICLSSKKVATIGWLFGAILFTLGIVITAIVSGTQKEKPKVFYALKGVSLLLLILFIVFIYKFKVSELCTSFKGGDKWQLLVGFENGKPIRKAIKKVDIRDFIIKFSLVLSYISVVISGTNIAVNAITGIED